VRADHGAGKSKLSIKSAGKASSDPRRPSAGGAGAGRVRPDPYKARVPRSCPSRPKTIPDT
jgi:hypothetical protein